MFLRNINVEYINMEQYDLCPGGAKNILCYLYVYLLLFS